MDANKSSGGLQRRKRAKCVSPHAGRESRVADRRQTPPDSGRDAGNLIAWMIARDAISPLCEQERISLELHGPPHTTNDDQMVAASMLGLRSTFKKGRNTVQDWRAIFTFGPRDG